MVNLNISSAAASDMTNRVNDVTVAAKNLDGAGDQDETEWTNSNWSKYWGYFNAVPDLKSALIMKAIWNVGKGYTADNETKVILRHISGWGKDTFSDILFNMDVMKRVGGDSFAEIIRDAETEIIINLKPLDPGTIKIIVDKKGRIKRYEQISKIMGAVKKFEPEDILHFSNNRLGDQIHGISDIQALEETIKADNENFTDMKKIMHHQARPFILWKLKTDDTTKINALITKIDNARNLGEDMFIPDDSDAVDYEIVQLNIAQTVLEWRNDLRNRFYRAIGLPQIMPGAGGQGTESESKVVYLAFEQIVEKEQKQIEEQILSQLNLEINLIPPATLSQELQRDESKDAGFQNRALIPNEMMAGAGK